MLNKHFFLRLSIFLTLGLIQALYTKYASLAISILGINMSIIFWYVLFLFSWILLEYRRFVKKISSIEWFHLLFWSFCLVTVMLLYLMYINIFMDLPNVKDSLVQNKWFTINITYTIEFKIKYFYAYLNYCVQDLNFSPEKNLFICNIFNNETLQIFLNNTEINVFYIQQYIGFLVGISSSYFDNKETLFQIYDMFFFDTPFATQVFILVRNILFIIFCGSKFFVKYVALWHIVSNPRDPNTIKIIKKVILNIYRIYKRTR